MTNKGKKWTLEDDNKLVKYLTEYRTLLNPYNANIKCPDYEKIAHELGRNEYAILLRVIDKVLFKKYENIDDVDFKELSSNYAIPKKLLKERFELNNMNTDMMGKKWTDEDDEYLKNSIEKDIDYIEIAKYLKRKPNGVIQRVIDKYIYQKYKQGIDIETLKNKYNINYSIEFLTKIFKKKDIQYNYIDNKEYIYLKQKEVELKNELKDIQQKIKLIKTNSIIDNANSDE